MPSYDEYDIERAKIARRRKVAEAMLAQSQQPLGDTQMVSGIAVRRSPLEGVAKVAQAYGAKVAEEKADTEAEDLRKRQRAEIAAAMGDFERATTARPAMDAVESPPDEIGGGPGREAQPAFTPSTADRRSAAMNLMGKIGDPRDAAKLLVADALRPPELKAYKPGDVLYQGGQRVDAIPEKPQQHVIEGKVYEVGPGGMREVGGPGKTVDEWSEPYQLGGATVQKNAKTGEVRTAVSRPPVTNVNTTIRENDKKFEKEDKLRNDYTANPKVKASAEMESAFRMIEAAYKNPTAANDLAMATKYMKILDPSSVVRESEFALAVNATGLLDKVQNYAASVLEGKKLNPTQRKDFYDSAKAINDAFQKGRGDVDREYAEIATGYGLEPKNVIPSLRTPARRSGDWKDL